MRKGSFYYSKFFLGAPGKPGQPVCKEHDRDHIDIEWDRPSSDGGSPITHYDVERKDVKTGRWIKVNSQPVKVSAIFRTMLKVKTVLTFVHFSGHKIS